MARGTCKNRRIPEASRLVLYIGSATNADALVGDPPKSLIKARIRIEFETKIRKPGSFSWMNRESQLAAIHLTEDGTVFRNAFRVALRDEHSRLARARRDQSRFEAANSRAKFSPGDRVRSQNSDLSQPT